MSTSKRKYVTSEGKTLEEADIKERIEKLRAIMNGTYCYCGAKAHPISISRLAVLSK